MPPYLPPVRPGAPGTQGVQGEPGPPGPAPTYDVIANRPNVATVDDKELFIATDEGRIYQRQDDAWADIGVAPQSDVDALDVRVTDLENP